ncbi:MAG: glycosyltransferase family 9 protein [Deltaproteobacteria bacterium]|nr:glycosyltransferase family 9 protein [Deltaproteobacteria bacterium]
MDFKNSYCDRRTALTTVVIEPMKLGDLVQSSPLLAALKKEAGTLTLVTTRPEVKAAAEYCALADEVVDISPEEFQAAQKLPSNLPDRPRLLVNLSSAQASLRFAQLFRPENRLGPKIGPNGVEYSSAQKLAAAVMSADRRLGRLNLVDVWRLLSPTAADSNHLVWPAGDEINPKFASHPALDKTAHPLIGLHLGSGHHKRRWPVERFVELAEKLSPAGLVIFGVGSEKTLAKKFMALYPKDLPRPADLTGQTSLADLGPILKKLDLFVSVDTGVMHIAAAAGAPVLAIFGGPALAGETGPYSPGSVVIQGYCQCSPCSENRPCPDRPFPALPCPALPDAASVLRGAAAMLSRPAPSGSPKTMESSRPNEGMEASQSAVSRPNEAAAASRSAVSRPNEAKEPEQSDLLPVRTGEGTGTWPDIDRSESGTAAYLVGRDDLGQILLAAETTWLGDLARLSVALRESSAKFLKPDHQFSLNEANLKNYRQTKEARPMDRFLKTAETVAASAIDGKAERKAFVEWTKETLSFLDKNVPTL